MDYKSMIIDLLNKVDDEKYLIYLYDFISTMIKLWHHKDG